MKNKCANPKCDKNPGKYIYCAECEEKRTKQVKVKDDPNRH